VVQTSEGRTCSTVELVHESLVHGWPTLQRWLDEHQDDAALVEQVRTAARQWAAHDRDPGLLWRGEAADEVRELRARYQGPMADLERAFLDAIVHHDAAARRRKCLLLIGRFALVLLFASGALTLAIVFQRQAAREKALNDEAEQKLALAQMRELERDQAQANADTARDTIHEQTQELETQARELEQRAWELEQRDRRLNRKITELHHAQELLLRTKEEVERLRDDARAAREQSEAARAAAEAARREAVEQRREAQRLRDEAEERRKRAEQLRGVEPGPPPPAPTGGR